MFRPIATAFCLASLALVSRSARADDESEADDAASARSHLAQGKALLDARQYDQAIVELETAKRHASSLSLQEVLAEAYRLAGRTQKAIAAYQELLAMDPPGEVADDARHRIEELDTPTDTRTPERKAEDAHIKLQMTYDLDHDEHLALAHKRHVGHIELIVGAALTAVGVTIFAADTRVYTAGVGGGIGLGGICSMIVGTITTIQGADSNPVVLPPPPISNAPPAGASWTLRF